MKTSSWNIYGYAYVSDVTKLYSHNARMMHWKLMWQDMQWRRAVAYWELGKRQKTKPLSEPTNVNMNYDITLNELGSN